MLRVFVVPHDPLWAAEFARESSQIGLAMGDLLMAIHHIGSTAIPGINAKPIIDMLGAVRDLDQLERWDAPLRALGYEGMGEFGIPGRRYYRKNDARGQRTHQLHTFQIGSPQIERHLAFRDFLMAHPEWAVKYDALKRELAAAHPTNLDAYMDGKDAFIQEMDVRAAEWRAGLANPRYGRTT